MRLFETGASDSKVAVDVYSLLNAGHFYRPILTIARRDTSSLSRGRTSGECGAAGLPW